MFLPHRLTSWLSLPAAALALSAGCAGLRCPRIDPTGERCCIWPTDEVRTPMATAPVVTGNIQAPPVGTDPVFPPPQIAAAPTAAPGVVAPVVTPASASMVPIVGDRLLMTPERVLAPVGSEVVLKASICATEGYTLADQKVEWMLGRNGVGQFVEVSGKGLFHPPLLPWAKGSKVDNYLAHGYTATGPLCITRGTADPTDDVNINRGDAWISVTSPNEGVSHVTAFTPAVESWDQRKAAATIYWVDVQWTFPPPVVNSTGRGETLTTLITRQTDGSPIEGWIVRYTVADGGAPSEVRTGPDGRASVDVAPTAAGAASSRIDVQLIRPAGYGGDAPRLIIGSGTTVVNWTGASQPYFSPGVEQPSTSAPPVQPAPAQPLPQSPITPQPQLPSATPARLELDVQGPSQAAVGATAQFQVIIRNVGDSAANVVRLTAQLDPGLVSPNNPTSDKIGYNVGTLGPRETRQVDLPFQVNKSGQLCHVVAVEFSGGAPVTKRSCLTGIEGAPQREARLDVQLDGDLQRAVGETAAFRVVVKNIGQTPLTNIEVIEEYPPAALQPQPTEPGVQVISGTITRRIDRLEVGQQRAWETPCLCRQATRVPALVRVSADTDRPGNRIETADDHTLEILLPRAAPPAGTTPPPAGAIPPAGAAPAPLSVKVSILNQPVLVNSSASVMVTVTNKSGVPEEQVALRVFFPSNVTPDAANASGPPGVTAQIMGDRLVFSPIAVLAANETASYRIPINPTQVGIVQIQAQAVSRNVRQGVSEPANLEIVSNRY
jgi:uncharacterized repeat protein (TIGR01451 family)